MESYPASQIMQAGFRDRIGSNMSLIVNGMYRVQRDLPEQLDVNMKLLLQDKVWVGMGHRFDYATNVQFGVLAGVLRLGYVFEFPVAQSYQLPGRTHEFTAILQLFGRDRERSGIPIW